MGGDAQHLLAHDARGAEDRAAAADDAAAPPRAPAVGCPLRVALYEADVGDVDPDLIGDQLRVRGVVPLTVRVRADAQLDPTVRVEAHARRLVGAVLDAQGRDEARAEGRHLNVVADA